MTDVKLPNGDTVRFSDDVTEDQINDVLKNDFGLEQGFSLRKIQQDALPAAVTSQFKLPSPEDQDLLDKTLPKGEEKSSLTPTTVLQDKDAMTAIRKYMTRFGGRSANLSDEEMVDQFLPRMRKWSAGQTVVTLDELYSLQKASDEDLVVAANAYDTFDRFSGVFSDDYTWGEMFDGLGSYARAVIIDPSNLLGAGIGRAIAGSSTKAGTVIARQIAKAASDKAMKKVLVQKLGAKGAKKVLDTTAKTKLEKEALGAAAQAARIASVEAIKKEAANTAVQTALKKQAIKQVSVATGVDSAVAAGVDVAYQEGMILSGRQEDYNPYQTGLSALAGVVGGGLSAATAVKPRHLASETEGVLSAFKKYNVIEDSAREAAESLSQADGFMKQVEENFTKWSTRVERGKEATRRGSPIRGADEVTFFREFLLGNADEGTRGLIHTVRDMGITLPERPRYAGDNVTSFVADTLERLPKAQKDTFERIFRETVGTHFPAYKNMSMKQFADRLSYQTSVAGQQLNISSQVKKILGIENIDETLNFLDTTVDDAVSALSPSLDESSVTKFIKERVGLKDSPRRIAYLQNMLIQTIVTHPGTTALNIRGSVFRGMLDTTADAVQGALYTGIGMRGFVTGNMEDFNKGIGLIRSAARRPVQLVHGRATMQEVEDYLSMRPEVEKVLYRYLSGGVENAKIEEVFGLDRTGKVFQTTAKGLEAYKNFAQKLYLTQQQDKVFKNLNFMYYLDKNIQEQYGMSYAKFMKRPDAAKIMQTNDYAIREFMAVEDTLSSVFAKSYVSRDTIVKNPIHFAATVIEDVRKVPIIGAALPFGQFFNGTVDMMADYSGVKLAYRLFGAGEGRTKEAITESLAKGLVGFGAVMSLVPKEMEYIDKGLGVFEGEEVGGGGEVVSKQYDFPESFFKAVARVVAYTQKEMEVPKDLQEQLLLTFGPETFTRNIGKSAGTLREIFGTTFDEGIVAGAMEIGKLASEDIGSAWLSGYTRPLDPINQLSGFLREGGTLVLDRNQGYKALNNSARYLDQIFGDVLISLGAEEKNVAYSDVPTGEVGKLFGHRTVPEQSYTQRMMNGIERPYWQSGFAGRNGTGSKKLDNRLNGFIFEIVEPRAARLVLSKNWRKMTTSERQDAVTKVWNRSREVARQKLLGSAEIEDFKLYTLDRVLKESGSQKRLKAAMDSLGMDKEIEEYNAYQLDSILAEIRRQKQKSKEAPYSR